VVAGFESVEKEQGRRGAWGEVPAELGNPEFRAKVAGFYHFAAFILGNISDVKLPRSLKISERQGTQRSDKVGQIKLTTYAEYMRE
jgi:hypothetical protein